MLMKKPHPNSLSPRHLWRTLLKGAIYAAVTAASIAVLATTFFLSVQQVYGASMAPTLQDGQILLAVRTVKLDQGDIAVFFYNEKPSIKRVIAGPADWVNMDADGTVYVNGERLEEPYIQDPAYGKTDIGLPCQVPEGMFFVMGDNRETAVDSRNTAVGCVAQDHLIGKAVLRLWPLKAAGWIRHG